MRLAIVVMVLCSGGVVHADNNSLLNFTVGPVVGLQLGGGRTRPILGVEGGAGYGPERINLGFEHRHDTEFIYVELDPWYVVGGTFGVGADTAGNVAPVLGVWEGIPLDLDDTVCGEWNNILTLAAGYRYTGVHELFVTLKAGRIDGAICDD